MTHHFWLWRLTSWFWRGLAGHFHDPGPLSGREKQGYIVWGPVVVAILTVESLGAFWDKFHDKIPTISSTVGHLETRWPWIAVIVVAVITIVAFLAVAYRASDTGAKAPHERGFSLWGLIWDELVVLVVIGFIVAKLSHVLDFDKHQMGYTVYGVLAVFGVIVPSIRALAIPGEPTLLSMVRSLRARLPWLTVVLVAGLTILVIHLAFYPWPDIPHE